MSAARVWSNTGYSHSTFGVPPEERRVIKLRRNRRFAVTGAMLGFVLALVAGLPASLVVNAVESATGGHFLLAEAEGTVWNGSALPVLAGGAGSRDASVLPSRLEWHLRPRWNGLSLRLEQACCLAQGLDIGVRRAQGAWQVAVGGPGDGAPVAQFPVGWLEGIGFPFNTIHAGGQLMLSTHQLAFTFQGGKLRTLGSAELEIRQMSSRLSTLGTLGSYALRLDADPATDATPGLGTERMRLTLTTLEGSLIADGTGQLGPRGGFRFRGEAKAAPGTEPALNNLLNLIGRRSGALSIISIG